MHIQIFDKHGKGLKQTHPLISLLVVYMLNTCRKTYMSGESSGENPIEIFQILELLRFLIVAH